MRRFHRTRAAFTLTELLVVIALIVVLGAIGIGAASKGYGWVKQRATETTINKIAQRFQRRINQIYKEAEEWPSASEPLIFQQAAGSMERAMVLKVLYLYKWSFPNTYAEAFHNVQESRLLYDPAGYSPARLILSRLTRGYPGIPDPFGGTGPGVIATVTFPPPTPPITAWVGGTPAVADMPVAVPAQSSACMLASYAAANGSPDDFTADELAPANSVVGDANQMLVDGWGTPLLCMRHGNFIHSRHRIGNGGVDRAAWWMGMLKPSGMADLDFAPLEYVLNPAAAQPPQPGTATCFYFVQIQQRAISSYGILTSVINGTTTGRDPFDPTAQLKNNINWRTNGVGAPTWEGWLDPAITPWLAPPGTGPQNGSMFRRTFGYSPELAATVQGYANQAYTPMFILSAGGDKIFSNWDDNLDSYRLKVNVSSQQ